MLKCNKTINNTQKCIKIHRKVILKNVNVNDKQFARTFVKALDEAEDTKYKPAQLTRECKEITGDKIKEFFGKR